MDSRKITIFVNKANRLLKLHFAVKTLQLSLCFGLAAALLVLIVSRLSIFPYYEFYAYITAASVIFIFCLWSIRKMPRRRQAIAELDIYTPHNQLLTLSQLPEDSHLSADLASKTEHDLHLSYQLFKKERNDWISAKWLLVSLGLSVSLVLAGLFPATPQLDAKEREQELALIEEIIEEVQKQKEAADIPSVKQQLETLEEKLKDSETPEQALRELVKKQKELELQKTEGMDEDSGQAESETAELSEASAQLAKQAGKTQTALSEMGKPVAFDLQQSIAASELSDDTQESDGSGDSASEPETASGAESESESEGAGAGESGSSGDGAAGSESPEQAGSAGTGDGQGSGDAGSASGGGQAEGQGSGDGEGSGEGEGGEGAPSGQGAGTGEGSRELLSIPSRLGGSADPTIDSGDLSEGAEGSVEEGPVAAERGIVRPYKDVVGSYSDSYFSSAQRMKLPPDLQKIVEQYFSEIESD